MPKRVVMIHTVGSLSNSFGQLCDEIIPGVVVEHVVDEGLLRDTLRDGALTDDVRARFAVRARETLASGPDAVVLTCSSVGPAADGLEVQRIDQAMADRAVDMGTGLASPRPYRRRWARRRI